VQVNAKLQNLMMKAENKGIEKGREEEKTNMIFHMLKEKFDVKTIMRTLNVSEETIKKSIEKTKQVITIEDRNHYQRFGNSGARNYYRRKDNRGRF